MVTARPVRFNAVHLEFTRRSHSGNVAVTSIVASGIAAVGAIAGSDALAFFAMAGPQSGGGL